MLKWSVIDKDHLVGKNTALNLRQCCSGAQEMESTPLCLLPEGKSK